MHVKDIWEMLPMLLFPSSYEDDWRGAKEEADISQVHLLGFGPGPTVAMSFEQLERGSEWIFALHKSSSTQVIPWERSSRRHYPWRSMRLWRHGEEHDHPVMMGRYNGKTFKQGELEPEIISHYLAEITYKSSEKWLAWYVVAFQLYINK